jgi:hypothetical protein
MFLRRSTFSINRPTVTPGAGPETGHAWLPGALGVIVVKSGLSRAYAQTSQYSPPNEPRGKEYFMMSKNLP